jgi:DNA-binding MarR family transcriptional regulator
MAGALQRDSAAPGNAEIAAPPAPMFDLIELFFFAYRDFVGDADRLLTRYNFGRAHHRVLYFVDRRPGLSVAELLDLLKITKQSLSRVLKDLLDQNYIEQRAGLLDRRQRLMFPTDKGEALALELAALQTRRFARALALLPEGARAQAAAFLAAMCDPAMCDSAMGDREKGEPAMDDSGKDDPAARDPAPCDPATGGAP